MPDYRMNQLQETLVTFIDDIFHLRTSGGLDKRITEANLRKALAPTKVTVSSVTTLDLSDYPGDLDIFADTSGGAIAVTLSNALADKANLKVHVEDGASGNELTLNYTGPGGAVSIPVADPDGQQTYLSNSTSLRPIKGRFILWRGSIGNTIQLAYTTILGNTGLSEHILFEFFGDNTPANSLNVYAIGRYDQHNTTLSGTGAIPSAAEANTVDFYNTYLKVENYVLTQIKGVL